MTDPDKLTLNKAETVALWHAVQWMDICLKQAVPGQANDDPSLLQERDRLKLAKQALRKVNAIRKVQAATARAPVAFREAGAGMAQLERPQPPLATDHPKESP